MGVTQAMRRVPRIKFPQRHPKPASGSEASSLPDQKDLFKFGPDGFLAEFYKDSWLITGSHVTKAVQHFLNTCYLPRKVKATAIALIPKGSPAQPIPASDGGARGYRFRSDVPAPPTNAAIGGKASLLPKRTTVSKEEIEAILLGGCF